MQTINGWDVRLTTVMGRIYNLRATKSFQSANGSQTHRIPGLPVAVTQIQGIPGCIQVADTIVNYGFATLAGSQLTVLSPGYGNAHTIVANGLICAD